MNALDRMVPSAYIPEAIEDTAPPADINNKSCCGIKADNLHTALSKNNPQRAMKPATPQKYPALFPMKGRATIAARAVDPRAVRS